MKTNLKFSIIAIACASLLLISCSNNKPSESSSAKETTTSTPQEKSNSSKATVENYFKYYNEKNKEKLLTTLAAHWASPNIVWGFENLDSMKLLDIKEDTSRIDDYLEHGNGTINNTTKENLKVYKVKYDVKYKDDNIGPQPSGTYEWWYYLTRKDKNSPWLIDDMGV